MPHHYVDSIEKYSSTKKKEIATETKKKEIATGLQAGNVNVMGVKKYRAQKEKEESLKHPGQTYTLCSDSNISENEDKIERVFRNRQSEKLRNQFNNTRSPTTYKVRRNIAQQLKRVKDITIFNGRDAKNIRTMRTLRRPEPGNSGFVCTVEWMSKNGQHLEPSIVSYEDCKRMMPTLVCDFYISKIVYKPNFKE